jgi:hypothetical protein
MNEHIQQYLSSIGKRGGKVSGGAKASASRANGKLGGRPKKNNTQELDRDKTGETNSDFPAFSGNKQKPSKVGLSL